jgi:hypothetical protein
MSTQSFPDPDWKEPLSPERIYDGPKTSVYRLPGGGARRLPSHRQAVQARGGERGTDGSILTAARCSSFAVPW